MNITNKLKELEDRYNFFYTGLFNEYYVEDKISKKRFYFCVYTLSIGGQRLDSNDLLRKQKTIKEILFSEIYYINLYFGVLANEVELAFEFSIENAGDEEVFVASCVDYDIVSQGKTPGEAVKNLKEYISQSFILYFSEFLKDPSKKIVLG